MEKANLSLLMRQMEPSLVPPSAQTTIYKLFEALNILLINANREIAISCEAEHL